MMITDQVASYPNWKEDRFHAMPWSYTGSSFSVYCKLPDISLEPVDPFKPDDSLPVIADQLL